MRNFAEGTYFPVKFANSWLRKLFAADRLCRLREQHGTTQAALPSPSTSRLTTSDDGATVGRERFFSNCPAPRHLGLPNSPA